MTANNFSSWSKGVGLGCLGVCTAFMLVLAVGEMASGDMSGAGHIMMALPFLVPLLIGWRHPIAGGAVSVVFGVGTSLYFYAGMNRPADQAAPFLLVSLPLILGGLLLVVSALGKGNHRAASSTQ